MVAVALVLHGSNVVGYTKCSKQASAQLRSYATQAVTSGLTVRACSGCSMHWSCTLCAGMTARASAPPPLQGTESPDVTGWFHAWHLLHSLFPVLAALTAHCKAP